MEDDSREAVARGIVSLAGWAARTGSADIPAEVLARATSRKSRGLTGQIQVVFADVGLLRRISSPGS